MEFKKNRVVIQTDSMGIVQADRNAITGITGAEIPEGYFPSKKPKLWDGALTVGFDRTRGNTDTTDLNGGFLLHRQVEKKNEFHIKGNAVYSSRDRKMNAQRYDAEIRYAYSFGKARKWYHFFKSELDRDRFANIDVRFVPSSGLGYWFSDAEDWKLLTELALGLEITKFRDSGDTESELVLIPRLFVQKKIFRELTAAQEVIAYPSLTDAGEYRLMLDSSLTNPISNFLALKVNWINEYNSDPGGDAKKHDMRLMTGLEYSF